MSGGKTLQCGAKYLWDGPNHWKSGKVGGVGNSEDEKGLTKISNMVNRILKLSLDAFKDF